VHGDEGAVEGGVRHVPWIHEGRAVVRRDRELSRLCGGREGRLALASTSLIEGLACPRDRLLEARVIDGLQ